MTVALDLAEEATPEGQRARGLRIPSVWLVAGGGWLGRGLQVLAQLVAVRILIQDQGATGYSVFAVLASLTGWLLLSDGGVAISMQNHISERRAAGTDADDVILTSALLSLVITVLVATVLLLLGPRLSAGLLGSFMFLSPAERTLAFYAMVVPGVGTALGGIVYRVWFAQHRGYLSNLLPAAGTVLGTGAIWLLQHATTGRHIAASTAAYYAPLALLPILALIGTVLRARRRGKRLNRALVRPLLSRAGRFWVSGLLAAAVLQVDFIIMAHVLTVHDIVIYSVASKLFLLILFVYSALLLALWPVCSEAIARQDWATVQATLRRYIAFGVCFTVAASIGVALLNQWVVRLLAPGMNTPLPLIVIVLLGIYTVARVWTDTFSTVLQSMNDLTVMVLVAPVQSLLSITLQWWGARWFGLPGLIGGLIGCFLLTAVWALPLRYRRHVRRGLAAG